MKQSIFKLFAGVQPGNYYPRPTGFALGDRTSPSFFPVVCSRPGDVRKSLPYNVPKG